MKVLIVCSGNAPEGESFFFKIHQPFIYEQIEALRKNNHVQYEVFFIRGKGIRGYLGNLGKLKKTIKEVKPDLIHAHYGTSGLLAILQRLAPVIITYHGSDINNPIERILSSIASVFASWRIFVSGKLLGKIIPPPKKNFSIIPCGIDLSVFYPVEQSIARKSLSWTDSGKKILFASSFTNEVKNYPLAKTAVSMIGNAELVELKNKTREQVNQMLNACDMLLLTSFSEGSPQVIKEAMACNCPIVATDVGDIREIFGSTEGCYITTFDPDDIASKIKMALEFGKRTLGREAIGRFSNKIIAEQIYSVYCKVLGQ
jgi:teichuronic acid biosynthesis glycosyltransferase TuaC